MIGLEIHFLSLQDHTAAEISAQLFSFPVPICFFLSWNTDSVHDLKIPSFWIFVPHVLVSRAALSILCSVLFDAVVF